MGFWVDRGHPDQKSMDFMKKVTGKKVFSLFTLGAKPRTAHAFKCAYTSASYWGEGCEQIGSWHCQGAIDPKLIEQMRKMPKMPGNPHAATPETEARWAAAASHPDAEEAVNDTYLALWDSIPPERPQPLEGYVHRTGRNVALKKLRFQSAQKRNSHYDVSLEELAGALPDNSLQEALDARALGQAIDRFLDTLSDTNRTLFLRRYWFGDQIWDIASVLGISENAATVRLSRLREKLRYYLYKEGIFDGP